MSERETTRLDVYLAEITVELNVFGPPGTPRNVMRQVKVRFIPKWESDVPLQEGTSFQIAIDAVDLMTDERGA